MSKNSGSLIHKNEESDTYDNHCPHPMSVRDDSAPERVMFNAQGALRLKRPLKSDGSSDSE